MKITTKQKEKANELACKILNDDIEFKDEESEIKAIEAVASYILEQYNKSEQLKTNNMKTIKISELIKDIQDCPLPLDVIPNYMGINLNSVDSISWERKDDWTLVSLSINFISDKIDFYCIAKGIQKCEEQCDKYRHIQLIPPTI